MYLAQDRPKDQGEGLTKTNLVNEVEAARPIFLNTSLMPESKKKRFSTF